MLLRILSFLFLLPLINCATNPATGEQQFSLMSSEQEIAMGRQAHADILQSMPVLDKPSLQRYVNDIGQKLAAKSERPDLPWTFTVLDDSVVNAFAVPGGYIYITRGLLTYLTSEAELAGVLGHEIGHVTARHSVNQISKAQLSQLGLGLGMILYPELQQFGRLAQQGLQILHLKYGRDDEREADRLGLRYMTSLQYSPHELAEVMDVLAAVSQTQGQERMPSWLSTHPDPAERRENILATIADQQAVKQAIVNRDEYLNQIDGLIFGENPREGFFVAKEFFHPELRWQIEFPEGWNYANQKQAVVAVSPKRDAVAAMGFAGSKSVDEAVGRFQGQQGIATGPAQRLSLPEAQGYAIPFEARTQGGALRGVAAFFSYRNQVYQLLSYGSASRWREYQPAVASTLASFKPITDAKILGIQPLRLDIAKLPRPMSLSAFAREQRSPLPVEKLALINHVDPGKTLPAGETIKEVDGQLPPGAAATAIY